MFLWCRDFHLTISFTENLILAGFELFSRQAKRVESFIFYPFSHRDTQSLINQILISEYDFAVNVVMVINIAIHKAFISHDLVNKLFTVKMFLAKRTLMF